MIECGICGKEPFQVREYLLAAGKIGLTPAEYVRQNEKTYRSHTDLFCCKACSNDAEIL